MCPRVNTPVREEGKRSGEKRRSAEIVAAKISNGGGEEATPMRRRAAPPSPGLHQELTGPQGPDREDFRRALSFSPRHSGG
mmetsp:Transcript_18051/g.36439  ORF Transcript_18051/g.36439 Transcript_18051/m.36439 type:complete len:81 (+) Transcript_18051:795-1037(+)